MNSGGSDSPAYQVLIEPEAHVEMDEAYNWYKGRKLGLGSDFLRALNDRLVAIEHAPTGYPIILIHKSMHIRRALLKQFPYGIIYFIKDRMVIVIACFHASRDPKEWNSRIDHTNGG
jgi:hypothetical protein